MKFKVQGFIGLGLSLKGNPYGAHTVGGSMILYLPKSPDFLSSVRRCEGEQFSSRS